jgi:hypothetical protein
MRRNRSRDGTPSLAEALLASTLRSRRIAAPKTIDSIDIVKKNGDEPSQK